MDLAAALDRTLFGLPDGFGTIAPKALSDQIAVARPFLLDVREKSEIEKGYLDGAIAIPIRTLARNLDLLPTDRATPIVVYRGSGHRSSIAMNALRTLGYTNVKSLAGGTAAWTAASLPLTTAPMADPAKLGSMAQFDASLVGAFDAYLAGLPDGFGAVQAKALSEQFAAAKPFLLDVRETAEASKGMIAGAVNVPIRGLLKNLDRLPTDRATPIVVYCGSGHRSAMAMADLRMLGYSNVRSLAGGTTAWTAASLPLTGAA
jgi:rhodanese-related sulfurtransferase